MPNGFNAILKYSNPNELKQFIENFDQKTHLETGIIYYYDLEKLWRQLTLVFPPIEAAGGLVLDDHHNFLVIDRLGKLDLPKGKREANESIPQTALREVEEECGLSHLEVLRPLPPTWHTYRLKDQLIFKQTHWFLMKYSGNQPPTPQLSEEIVRAFWMKKEEIQYFNEHTYASIKEVVKPLQNAQFDLNKLMNT